ncbi:hypothetical protein ACEYYA_15455 [Paracoccus sp. p3-h83]|uniref:hypothetical protein n=1 Tax=Paracoccus sp. p3-h83 TaxID=3342805 RepID=UPI0035BAFD22
MTFYAGVFGGQARFLRYADMPVSEGGDDYAHSAGIFLAEVVHDGRSVVSGSDYPDGVDMGRMQGAFIGHDEPDRDRARALFDTLSDGGAIIWPWGAMEPMREFGMCCDRFGTNWLVAVAERGASACEAWTQ